MTERYYLKTDYSEEWTEVSKEAWIRVERLAGFRPKLWSGHPEYMTTCATGGFSGAGHSGKIDRDDKPA